MTIRGREAGRPSDIWKQTAVADDYQRSRTGIPYAGDHFDIVHRVLDAHRLKVERLQSLYAEILQMLRPGGIFANIEHVKSATPAFQQAFERNLVENIHAADQDGRTFEEIAAECHARWDKEINILARVEDQLSWLRGIGFTDVDCHFKCFELAVFAGRRPDFHQRESDFDLTP